MIDVCYICFVLRAYKYRIIPSVEQAELINKHIGSCRDINAAINIKQYSLTKNCGGVRRGKPAELPTLVGALKQENI